MTAQLFPQGIPAAKRIFDLLLILLGLPLVLPLAGITAVLVRLLDGKPLLFRQTRPGYKGRLFEVYKFRTMRIQQVDAAGNPIKDAERITPLGRFLRRTSLDELPELWNVIRGEMSLVGPRPLLPAYLDRYNAEQARRHDVLPGITGWAQVNGRNILSWEDRFRLDVWYVDHWSIWLDIRILVITIWKVLLREGVEAKQGVIMEEFKGSSASR